MTRILLLGATLLTLNACQGEAHNAFERTSPIFTNNCPGLCEAPPTTCEDEQIVTYSAKFNDACSCKVTEDRRDCAIIGKVCSNGACLDGDDPCVSVTCDEPPAARCDGLVAITHAPMGTCDEGDCTYAEERRDCEGMGMMCMNGRCEGTLPMDMSEDMDMAQDMDMPKDMDMTQDMDMPTDMASDMSDMMDMSTDMPADMSTDASMDMADATD